MNRTRKYTEILSRWLRQSHLFNHSGQLLVVAVFIVVVLTISIALVVFLNQMAGKFGVSNSKRQKASSATQQGLAYAIHTLSYSTYTWTNALQGIFPDEYVNINNSSCNPYGLNCYDPGISGNLFTISCSTGVATNQTPIASYQVGVLITAYTQQQGSYVPTRALSAVLSQKTASVTLPNMVTASSALELFNAPSSSFTVHWGSISMFDPNHVWDVLVPLDKELFPRKFAQNGITGIFHKRSEANPPVNSDGVEYWAYSSLGYPPGISQSAYQSLAQATTLTPATTPVCKSGTCLTNCPNGNPCADFENPGDTFIFGNSSLYTLQSTSTVIFINGNAEFDTVSIDLKDDANEDFQGTIFPSTGAIIVTGSVTFGSFTVIADGLPLNHIRVPLTTPLEYPYYKKGGSGTPANYPCSNTPPGGTCNTNQAFVGSGSPKLHFRGFLYVMGNLYVSPNIPWNLDGVVMVGAGGQLQPPPNVVANGNMPFINYDDEINRSILVDHMELQVDTQQEVIAR
jgi:hypothetical protein